MLKKRFKQVFLVLAVAAVLLISFNWQMAIYLLRMGRGQMDILINTRPIVEVVADSTVADSIKLKLALVGEIKAFAENELGFTELSNYSSFYDQKNKPALWVVSACEAFQMQEYKWSYPFLGDLAYKGFFDKALADKEAEKLKLEGLDADVDPVSAWSTLGWLPDPVLSGMLRQWEGQIARLIIHELTHANLYISGDADYSENLATFIGDKGAFAYLEMKYGVNSQEVYRLKNELSDTRKFSAHMLNGYRQLDSLYTAFAEESIAAKTSQKQQLILSIFNALDTISFANEHRFKKDRKVEDLPNNTYFITYKMYRSQQHSFEDEFQNEGKSNIRNYLVFLKEKYGSSSFSR